MSHWSSANTSNRVRLARALAADTGVGYQKCLRVVVGVADAALLPAFNADSMDASVRALAPLVLLQSVKGKSSAGSSVGACASVGSRTGFAVGDASTLTQFSPHAAIAIDCPPGVAITGAPGAGKSFCAFSLAYQMTVDGVRTVYLDPRGDAMALARVRGVEGAKVFDLRNGDDGMLNPFALTDDMDQSALLAVETVRLLLGGRMSPAREDVLVAALNAVSTEPSPSLGRVVDVLLADTVSAEARSLGLTLDLMRKLPFGRLCFGEHVGTRFVPADSLTVITMLGLDLPSSDLSPDDYSYENRLGVSVMHLLTRQVHGLMLSMDRSLPKAVIIDEARCVTSTASGARLISEVGRMGRSHNTALVLVTQDAGDLMLDPVRNAISTVFVFRGSNPDEVDSALELVDVERKERNRRVMRELANGECLMRDADGQVTRVQIGILSRDDMIDAVSGNPRT